MNPLATWHITIERLEGSRIDCTQFHGRAPMRGEEIDVRDEATGSLIRARIEAVTAHEPRIGAIGLGIFQLSTKEIS
jgi:hypothetical protein